MEVMGTYGLMGFLSLQRASEREIGEERRWSLFVCLGFVFVFQGSDDANVVCRTLLIN